MYIMIRIDDNTEADRITRRLLMELNNDGLRWEVGTGEQVYYAASNLAEDISDVVLLAQIEDD
jgi:hypothetical protein